MSDPTSILNLLEDPALLAAFSDGNALLRGEIVGTSGSGRPLTSFTHDCRPPPITQLQKAFRFYDDKYDIVAQHFLKRGEKKYLGTINNQQCRFCGGVKPNIAFRKIAHAVPESLGNKTLFSRYECDDCNKFFGDGIEDDFGNWSNPMRTLARVIGKKRIPTIKQNRQGGWRVEGVSRSELRIMSFEENPAIEVDEDNKRLKFLLHRDSYTPVGVLKALVKMGLTIMPDAEMVNFRQALGWIREKTHSQGPSPNNLVIHTSIPGPAPNDFIALLAFAANPVNRMFRMPLSS